MLANALVRHLLEAQDARNVVIVVLRRKDGDWQSLIVRRASPPAQGMWACPGGHVDAGESDRAAASRELKEETGFTAGKLHKLDEEDIDIGHLTFFWTQVDDDARAQADDDAEKCRWVSVDDLPELAWENARQIADARTQADRR